MDYEVFMIYDSKADYFKYPQFFESHAGAVRWFTNVANDGKTEIGQFPADFSLMYCGKLSELTANLEGLKAPENLGLGSSYLREVKNA